MERIPFPKNWSPFRRKLEREEGFRTVRMSPAEEISRDVSSLVCQSVSQSVSQFFDEENGGATWTSLVAWVARKWGVRDWFASVRGSATRHESHLSSLASITGWERVGAVVWIQGQVRELAWWIRELGAEAAFRISSTHEVAPVLGAILPHVPPLAACHLERIESSRPSSFPLFHPSRRIRFVSTSLSRPIHPVSLSPLRFSPPSLLAIILRSLRELLHFVSLFHSPHPRPFSLPFQSH